MYSASEGEKSKYLHKDHSRIHAPETSSKVSHPEQGEAAVAWHGMINAPPRWELTNCMLVLVPKPA